MSLAVYPDPADAVPMSLVDLKGDLIAATGPDAVARVAVGTDGQALIADSTQPAGVRWADSVSSTAGSYTGTGTLDRTIALGFTPKFVYLLGGPTNGRRYFFSEALAGSQWAIQGVSTVAPVVATDTQNALRRVLLVTGGFKVDADSFDGGNANGEIYYYFAIG